MALLASKGDMRNVYRIVIGKPDVDHLRDLIVMAG
jgi:hypothetical protein